MSDLFSPGLHRDDQVAGWRKVTDAVHAAGGRIVCQIVEQGFAILDPTLARHDYAVGDRLSIADAALFYAERWAPQANVSLPTNLKRHFERMLARPAVQKVRQLWGET